jgi:hypothetical protein
MSLYKLIKDTNGDALGVVLFILLIFYFVSKYLEVGLTLFEIILLLSSLAALVVDGIVVYNNL